MGTSDSSHLGHFPGGPVAKTMHGSSTVGLCLIFAQGTKSRVLQVRVQMLQLRPSAAK